MKPSKSVIHLLLQLITFINEMQRMTALIITNCLLSSAITKLLQFELRPILTGLITNKNLTNGIYS